MFDLLEGFLSFLLNENILKLENGGVSFLEWELSEFVSLSSGFNNSTINFALLALGN